MREQWKKSPDIEAQAVGGVIYCKGQRPYLSSSTFSSHVDWDRDCSSLFFFIIIIYCREKDVRWYKLSRVDQRAPRKGKTELHTKSFHRFLASI